MQYKNRFGLWQHYGGWFLLHPFCGPVQVLATDKNPDIEYEYWLPPDQYALHHGRKSPLRQAHHTANYLPWDEPFTTATTTATTTTTRAPPITTRPHWCK